MEDNYIGRNLRELRRRKGVTQAEVAEAIKIPATTYSAYETGQNTPRDKVKIKLAEYFGKSVNYIFFHEIPIKNGNDKE